MLAPRSFVGLDFGSHGLKAAEVVRSNGGLKITRLGIVETPTGAVSKGVAADPDALLAAIQQVMREAGIRTKRVATALGGQAVIIRELTLPEMPDAELQRAVMFEAERYLAPGAGDVVADYRLMARVPQEGTIKVLLVAAGKTLIDRQLAPLARAGLAARVVESTPIAMVRALASCNGAAERATMYVDVGAETTDVMILEGGRLRLSRNIEIGGNALTRALADSLRIDWAAAQSLKEQQARILLRRDKAPDDVAGRVHRAILPVVTNLATELRRSLDFYLERLGGAAVSKVIVVGGTARLGNLAAFLGEQIDVPVEIGNPLGGCEIDAGLPLDFVATAAPVMAAAIGLAMRGARA